MRIVVFSDSHGNCFALKNIVRTQREADLFLHLGDGERDFDQLQEMYPGKEMYKVRGNGDWTSRTPAYDVIMCAGKTVFFTHGHTFSVKSELDSLKAFARKVGADIALFGHTHKVYTCYEDGLYLMNPGSVSLPASGGPSYGVIDILQGGDIALNIVQM